MTAIGLSAGIVIGVGLANGLRTWLNGVTPADPVTLVGVVIVLGVVAAISSYLPTRRAIRIDPVAARCGMRWTRHSRPEDAYAPGGLTWIQRSR